MSQGQLALLSANFYRHCLPIKGLAHCLPINSMHNAYGHGQAAGPRIFSIINI